MGGGGGGSVVVASGASVVDTTTVVVVDVVVVVGGSPVPDAAPGWVVVVDTSEMDGASAVVGTMAVGVSVT